MSTIKK